MRRAVQHLAIVLFLYTTTVYGCTRLGRLVKPWDGGFQGEFKIPISSGMSTWTARVTFEHPVKELDIWSAKQQRENDKTFILRPLSYNGNLGAGQTLDLGFVVHYSDNGKGTNPCLNFFAGQSNPGGQPTNPVDNNPTNPGTNNPTNPGTNNPTDPAKGGDSGSNVGSKPTPGAKYNYDDALHKALLFFEAQRSGKLPSDNMIPYRGHSGLDDGKDVGKDLTGGWHDAGDHVKFGLPMASSATMLLHGLEFLKQGYQYANQYDMGKRQVRWALEYFIKCHVDKDKLYVQVADGDADHGWWGRPEDNHQFRPAFWMGAGKPQGGADVAGETAAAMAAGSVVFKDDAAFSAQLLSDAKSVYNLAKKNPGVQSKVIPNINKFYNSDSFKDELAHAAAWLAYAVGSSDPSYQGYINEAKQFLSEMGGGVPWAMSWNEKRPAVNFLMFKLTGEGQFKQNVENFLRDWRPGGSVPRTPQGLVWRDMWGSNRYAANAACVAMLAAKAGINAKKNFDFAASQLNFFLGDSGRSYVVGFGHNFPQRAHHKAASCPNRPASCGWDNLHTSNPNPQILNGALVGGPGDVNGNFIDNRDKFEFTEVATDYNAGFTSALAGMKYFLVHPV